MQSSVDVTPPCFVLRVRTYSTSVCEGEARRGSTGSSARIDHTTRTCEQCAPAGQSVATRGLRAIASRNRDCRLPAGEGPCGGLWLERNRCLSNPSLYPSGIVHRFIFEFVLILRVRGHHDSNAGFRRQHAIVPWKRHMLPWRSGF